MGKGDMKTKKGKITAGSYGNTRKRKTSSTIAPAKVKAVKKEESVKKAPAKKTPAKKAAKSE